MHRHFIHMLASILPRFFPLHKTLGGVFIYGVSHIS